MGAKRVDPGAADAEKALGRLFEMSVLSTMIILALLATVGALGVGVVSMMRGGDFDQKHSAHLMYARVGFQGAALVLLLIALYFEGL